ncbi:hypothetical protein [Micromonospora musae]|uniref:Uncharacterized protein n=1 Tax=Micromonospora musae TaxID=1894970 RepID=A0A3A9YIK5_9ACTN|nr:hypothetical protein [Micromonospora musae]RKN32336.1 hypothetical protein D7044_13870 [Micromonospora musae]
MAMDKTLLLGAASPDWDPQMSEVVADLEVVLGFRLFPKPAGEEMFLGGDDRGHAWLTLEWEDFEPFRSHPFNLDVTTSEPELPYVTSLFERLADLARYRVILLLDHACIRSTHFPCEAW